MKVIVSGGGTAGHIYPALAVADKLRARGAEVLFVGAEGKMEMSRVPAAGYQIIGLPIVGIARKLSPAGIWHNVKVPFKLMRATDKAKRIIRDFAPDVVVGFGGYASAPIMRAAQAADVPTVLQEQNSYAGLTNRMLAKRASTICTAYEGMERFFPAEKITITGNPLRGNIAALPSREEGAAEFGFDPTRPTILITGGSLGTRTLNEAVMRFVDSGCDTELQIIWQCGKFYHDEFVRRMGSAQCLTDNLKIKLLPFIERMDCAYAAADVVICRAGASTVSELQLIGLPAIFVPSPNVAEDHQTANARSIVNANAALLVPDSEAIEHAIPMAIELLGESDRLTTMRKNLKALGKPNAARDVADIVERQVFLNREKCREVYFVGIGGIGMSALARFFAHQGYAVAGYDRTRTRLTETLEREGIAVHYDDDIKLIPHKFRNPATTRVIYTPAVPEDHSELAWFRHRGFEVAKRSRALGILCEGKYTMAVAGTHGKSTTSTLVAWLNHNASTDGTGSAFLGAISKNFETNTVMGSGERMAVEADEFDRSFHQLHPAVSLITSIDPDHLDIYGTAEAFVAAFDKFADQTSDAVIVKYAITLHPSATKNILTYSLDNTQANYYAMNIELIDGGYYRFDIVTPSRVIVGCKLGIPGIVNVENAVGAVALIDQRGFDEEKLRAALASFSGIERRFDFLVNTPQGVYMDDYAHHPEELRKMLQSVRSMFPCRHVTVCFQPHLYTRTRDFYSGFASSLSLADRVVLIPIYPAREEPIEGISSSVILDLIDKERLLVEKSALARTLAELPTDVVITAGAGDIDTLRQEIAEVVKQKIDGAKG